MDYNRPTILFTREVPWHSYYDIATLRIAKRFAEAKWNVIWITSPLMPWNIKPRNRLDEERFYYYKNDGVFIKDNIFAYTPRTFLPFSRYSPFDHPWLGINLWRFCYPSIKEVLIKKRVPFPDIVWLSTYNSSGVMDLFPGISSIFHVTDNYIGFSSVPMSCRKIEKEGYKRADCIIVTSPLLKEMISEDFGIAKDKIVTLIHSIDYDAFKRAETSSDPLSNLPHPRFIYVGNTSRIDYNLLENLLKNIKELLKDYSVIIIGEKNNKLVQLSEKYNLILLGTLPSYEVPKYLINSDVGLLLTSLNIDLYKYTLPMKAIEYTASSLPIISIKLPVFEHLDLPVVIVDLEEEDSIKEGILKAIDHNYKIQIKEKYKDFVYNQSWEKSFERILELNIFKTIIQRYTK